MGKKKLRHEIERMDTVNASLQLLLNNERKENIRLRARIKELKKSQWVWTPVEYLRCPCDKGPYSPWTITYGHSPDFTTGDTT